LVVLGINAWNEPKDDVARFVREHQLKHRILLDGKPVAKELYGVKGIPTVLFIDKEGVVVDVEVDFSSPEHLEARVKKLVGG